MSAKDAKAFFEIVPGAKGGVAKATAQRAKGRIVDLGEVAGSLAGEAPAKTGAS